MVDVIEPEATLDAQPVLIRRAVASRHVTDLVVLDVIGDLAADPAVRAHAVDPAVDLRMADACSSTIEDGIRAPVGQAWTHSPQATVLPPIGSSMSNTIFEPTLRYAMPMTSLTCTAAGAHVQIAVDAGVQVHRHRGVAEVGRRARAFREARAAHAHPVRPLPQLGSWCATARSGWSASSSSMTIFRAVCPADAVTTFMPAAGLRMQDAASTRSPSISTMQARQLPSARIAGLGQPAQVRDVSSLTFGHLPDGLAGPRLDLAAVERELDGISHDGLT